MAVRNTVRFWLNDELVELDKLGPAETLLDFLRLDRKLRGTKEGCAEGDCGACTVLVGRLNGDNLIYETVNACIRFVASLDGCHVVSVEHLSASGTLNVVQQAMVDQHGSQCGFCTPGIVMSLYQLWMENPNPDDLVIEQALQGNLCRCTGYAPIVRAAKSAAEQGGQAADALVAMRDETINRLKDLRDGARVEIDGPGGKLVLPADVDDLAALLSEHPKATIVAGATDVGLWVTKFMRDIAPAVFIGHLDQLKSIAVGPDSVTIGAGVSYSAFWPVVREKLPQLDLFWSRIGGQQVRNMGTIGGNIANGSPIGDTPPALIALGAAITLRKGDKRRFVPLEEFFIAYGKQDREPGEFVESVSIPYPDAGDHFAVYKISKRRDEDISALCGAFRISLDDEGKVASARIAFGGMAATPKRAKAVEMALVGQSWTAETVAVALDRFDADFQPISDMRASAEYRALSAKNLLRRFHLETTGQQVQLSRGAA